MQVDFDDDKVGNRSSALKFKSNTWNRFSILDMKVEYVKAHYKNGYRICTAAPGPTQDPHKRCAYCENLTKEAFDRFAVNVCHYFTDPQGQPFGELGPRSFEITWWPFSTDRWETVRMFKKTYGDLRKRDVLFHCTEENYQKGDMHIAPDAAWWGIDPAFQKMVVERFKQERTDLSKKLAKHLVYEQQIAELQSDAAGGQQGGRPGQGGGRSQGGQPQFNPAMVQGMIGPPMGAAPLFNVNSSSQPRFNQPSQPDMSVLDTGSAKESSRTPDPMDELSAVETNPAPASGMDTSDLDAMLKDF